MTESKKVPIRVWTDGWYDNMIKFLKKNFLIKIEIHAHTNLNI